MRTFPGNLATFEQKKLFKNLDEIFANLIQTLTSEARGFNPKACGGFKGTEPPQHKKNVSTKSTISKKQKIGKI